MTEITVKFTAAQVEQDCPKLLQDLQKRIAAHLDKAGKYEEKAEQHRTSAGQLFAQVKETCDESGFAAFHEKFFPNLGRSRTYELLAIGTGKKSVEEVRASTRERVARYRASKAASVTVTDNTKPLQETDQERRDREECVALYQKVLDAEREQAQWLAEHPRATSAEVSAEATERPARKSRAQRQYEKLLYAWINIAVFTERHLDQLRELQAGISDLKDLAGEPAAIAQAITDTDLGPLQMAVTLLLRVQEQFGIIPGNIKHNGSAPGCALGLLANPTTPAANP